MSSNSIPRPLSAIARRALIADLLSTAVFPLAITGSTTLVPIIHREFGTPVQTAAWVVLAYNILFAATLLGAGRLADRSHRARFFALGNLTVATAGIASAMAPSAEAVIAFRAVAGLGAAMCAAGGSSMILAAFPPDQRPRVYRYSGAVLGAGLTLGPLVSQALVSAGGWRLVFAAPTLLALAAALMTLRLPDWPRDTSRVDVAGVVGFAILVSAGSAVLALIGVAPAPNVLGAALVVLWVGVAFVRREARAEHPALPLDLLRIPDFRWYATASGAFMGCLVSALTLFPLLHVLEANRFLPAAAMMLVTATPALLPLMVAPLTSRAPRQTVRVALAGCCVSAVLIATSSATAPLGAVSIVVGAVLLGVSLGITQGVPDGQALSHVPATRGGAGAALFSTTRMTIETLVLAATTGAVAVFGAQGAALIGGSVCALVMFTAPRIRRGGTPTTAHNPGDAS